mgnify:FL=1
MSLATPTTLKVSSTQIESDTDWITNKWDGSKQMMQQRLNTNSLEKQQLSYMVFDGTSLERHQIHERLQSHFRHVSYPITRPDTDDSSDDDGPTKRMMIISLRDMDPDLDLMLENKTGIIVTIPSPPLAPSTLTTPLSKPLSTPLSLDKEDAPQPQQPVKSRKQSRRSRIRHRREASNSIRTRCRRAIARNLYPLFVVMSGIIVSYLLTMPCETFIEECRRLGDNVTTEDALEIYNQIMTDGSSYDQNCLTLWWKALFLFTLLSCFIRQYHQD